jgi:hypothetical protein
MGLAARQGQEALPGGVDSSQKGPARRARNAAAPPFRDHPAAARMRFPLHQERAPTVSLRQPQVPAPLTIGGLGSALRCAAAGRRGP